MDVPPVVVTHTEWRTCGTPGGYSLPLCLNDSDSDLSTRGTPISDKVQMIIESLRSTQSSVEMGDEKERQVLSGQGHSQACKVAMGPFVGANPNVKSPILYQKLNPSAVYDESHDSDSDDSVDKGIEAAILEYLKEKDGPKRKSDACSSNTLQASKVPSKSPIPGISTMNSDSTMFLAASKEFEKRVEEPIAPTSFPIKKYIKHKTSINEGSFTKQELDKNTSTKNDVSIDQTNKTSTYLNEVTKVRQNLESVSDSSSDDGIEEAIQKYQMEKNQQIKRDTLNQPTLSEDSDSSSDDGIEEAIRCYQLEQLKEKSYLKPLSNKTKKTAVGKCTGKGNTNNLKKCKLKKKKNKMKDVLPVSMQSNKLPDSIKGNGLHSFKVESSQSQCAPPKTNTTAELMCAEAILDISKTVMPGAFQQTPGQSNSFLVGSCAQPTFSKTKQEEKSDDSSIDSEDGIEQEIRRFLEQKAKLHKQTPCSEVALVPGDKNESAKTTCVKKPGRLSLTKRRKQNTENLSFCTMSALSNVKGMMCKTFADSSDESTPSASPVHMLKNERSGDKSSSLDSDEDLDLAIKDLLKTKKKVKKKPRDLKRKPEKCFKKDELQVHASLSKKTKSDPLKHSSLKKLEKTKNERLFLDFNKPVLFESKGNTGNDVKKQNCESSEGSDLTISTQNKPTKEEDSSVDSDDSIELEIRKFLAEKAKVAPTNNTKEAISANGISSVCSGIKAEDVELEIQQAEIPRENTSLHRPMENQLPKEKLPLLSPQSYLPENLHAGGQSRSPSSSACSPSLLESGKEVGVIQLRSSSMDCGSIQDMCLTKETKSVPSPHLTPSQSASIKWRQSLGLPITDIKIRTPFQISSSKTNDSSSATRPSQSVMNLKLQNPAWSSTKTMAASFPPNTETLNATHRSHALSHFTSARQHPAPFAQRLAPSFSSQYHIEEETKSMVHISKDKSVYVELETNRTNHVQVRSRDRCEKRESDDLLTVNSSETKREKLENKDINPDIKMENFVDEADFESGKSDQEKKQSLFTL